MKYKKLWLLASIAVIFCFFGISIFITDSNNQPLDTQIGFQEQIQGKWKPILELWDIFEGEVHIIYVKSRPGSYHQKMMFIYDQEQHGLMCSPMDTENKEFVCAAVYINKIPLTSKDYAHLVNNPFNSDPEPIMVKFKLNKTRLIIYGTLLTKENCPTMDECKYRIISKLKKQSG